MISGGVLRHAHGLWRARRVRKMISVETVFNINIASCWNIRGVHNGTTCTTALRSYSKDRHWIEVLF